MKNWGQYLYYILCGIICLVVLIFVPMLASPGITLAMLFPTTTAGWIVWGISKGATIGLNLMILHCLVQQGKVNIKDDPRYLEARDMMMRVEKKEEIPLSPAQHYARVYGKKMTTLSITTLLSLIGFGSAIIVFSVATFLAQLISIVIAVSFGLFQMKQEEEWWVVDYFRYAKYYTEKQKENEQCLNTTTDNTEASKSK